MDELTAVLTYISQLDIDDIDDLQSRSTGKDRREQRSGPASPLSDEELAFRLFAEEAQALLNITKDHIISHNDEDGSNHSLVEELVAIEDMARYDREMAIALSQGRDPPPRRRVPVCTYQRTTRREIGLRIDLEASSVSPATSSDTTESSPISSSSDELSERSDGPAPAPESPGPSVHSDSSDPSPPTSPLHQLFVDFPVRKHEDEEESATSSKGKATTYVYKRMPCGHTCDVACLGDVFQTANIDEEESATSSLKGKTTTPLETCVICTEIIEQTVVRMPCGHTCDVACLEDMFRAASIDESVFPPRCCQTAIPLADVRHHLESALVDTFQKRSLEFSITNRVYCHRPKCSVFLGAATIAPSVLECVCSAETCGSCKEAAHPNKGCSPPSDQAVLGLAKTNGWQRCPGCFHLVELFFGCYHIQCICKKQFCYLCGVAWKGCSCPQFAEERLLLHD